MGTFASLVEMLLVCGIFGLAAGIGCMLINGRSIFAEKGGISRESVADLYCSVLAAIMGVGVASLWTVNASFLMGVAIIAGFFGKKAFNVVYKAIKRHINSLEDKID